MVKDLFSDQADYYSKFRPEYPSSLYEYILQFVPGKEHAWDCATGNGQAAKALAKYFKYVEASDISEAQLKKAHQEENIHYHQCPAEKTPFPDKSFDLITIATAYHWLNQKAFHEEALRVAKKGAVIAAWAYNLVRFENDNMNRVVDHFYYDIIHDFWDPERRHVENSYKTVDFDFDPLPSKDFRINIVWTKEHFKGYLRSWSAVQNYINKHEVSPIHLIEDGLDMVWGNEEMKLVSFPLFLKIGMADSAD
jgi:SAM-dependent methyltransferase